MTLRAKSQSRQWKRWLVLAAVALAAYALLSCVLCGTLALNVFKPEAHRLALPIALLFAYLAWETRWDGVTRRKTRASEERVSHASFGSDGERERAREDTSTTGADADAPSPVVRRPSDAPLATRAEGERAREGTGTTDGPSGEALYAEARGIPHLPVPDFLHDGVYLDLLGRSAAQDYGPALAKLGEYAMRRAAWVEAYYWFWRARRKGLPGLDSILPAIRRSWVNAGFPDEAENVHPLFPEKFGSIGRALLHIDAGQQAVPAREFLKAHHPEALAPID